MALTDYRAQWDNTFEEVFNKTLVGKEITNMRYEPTLTFGASVVRKAMDISQAYVRDTVRGAVSTIDPITDTTETLTVNLEKELVFHISDGEVKQAGDNPGEKLGAETSKKVACDLDARIFAEVLNAYQTFDTGDLTTLVSTGVGITLSDTTVPQMIARMPAKLRKGGKQTLSNMALVIDSYAASDIEHYLLGKQFDIVGSVLKNGYAGDVSSGQMYISENLTGTAHLFLATNPSNGDTVVINGVTLTFVSSIGTTAGNVLIGSNAAASRVNLVAAINNPETTSATQVALTAANQALFKDEYRIVAEDDIANTAIDITGTGSGRLTVSETLTNAADIWSKNVIHCFYGKKGSIDLVVQDLSPVDMRPCSDRRGTNVFSSYLAGLKTFADGARKFLDVWIA